MDELIDKAYKKANFYYYAVFAKAGFFALLGFIVNRQYPTYFNIPQEIITLVSTFSMLYLIASIPFALWIFSKKVAVVATIEDETSRYTSYMNWVKIRMGLIGTNFVLNVILYFTMHSMSFFYAAGIGSIAMFFCKPSKINIGKELNPVTEIEKEI